MFRLLIKEYRKRKHMTQRDLAEAINATERVVGSWERGETPICLDDACIVARALGCTPNDLCNWYEDNPQVSVEYDGSYERELVDAARSMDEIGRDMLASNARWLLAEHPGEESEIRVEKTA